MTENLVGGLEAVLDRCALTPQDLSESTLKVPGDEAHPTSEESAEKPSYFFRVPTSAAERSDLKMGPKLLLGVLDAEDRRYGGQGSIRVTDRELAKKLGTSIKNISRWLGQLEVLGLIERILRTSTRIIRLLFQFRSASPASPKNGGKALPPNRQRTSPKMGQDFPQNGAGLPPKSPDILRVRTSKKSEARSSSSSPGKGDTPTTAKTKATPPTSAPPPLTRLERQRAERAELLEARWAELSPEHRHRIEAHAAATYPWLKPDRDKEFFRAMCLDAIDQVPAEPTPAAIAEPEPIAALPGDDQVVQPIEAETKTDPISEQPRPDQLPATIPTGLRPSPASPVLEAEILPTDKELRNLKLFAFATDPEMQLFARQELTRLGRADVFRNQAIPTTRKATDSVKTRPAGKSRRCLPAGPSEESIRRLP